MCLFCKIVDKEIPASVELENDEFMAFADINPIAPIHLLVIPKKHIDSFQELDGKTMAKMTEFIQKLAQKMGLDKDGYRLLTNIGENGGQEIKHLHFHLVGGTKLKWVHLSDDMDKVKEAI